MILVLYFGLAIGLLFCASRFIARVEPRVAVSLALAPLLFAVGPLAQGRVFVPSDIAFSFFPHRGAWEEFGVRSISAPNFSDIAVQLVPWQEAVRFDLRHGAPPLWNPFVSGGDILLGSMQPAPFYPLNVLGWVLPLADAVGFVLLATLFLAGLGTYLLLHDMGVRPSAALFGAVAFEYSKYVFFWAHWNVGYAASLAPFALLVARRLAARPSFASFWGGVATASALIVAGHPESALILTVPAALLFVERLIASPPRDRMRAIVTTAAACLLALLLTAPAYLPFVEAMPQSFESDFRRTEIYRSVVGVLPLGQAMDRASATFLPYTRGVFGKEIPKKAQGGFSGDEATGYCGTVALALALLGLTRRSRLAWLLGGLSLFGLLLACRAPGFVEALQRLPLFDRLIFDYFYLWPALGTSCLAAMGVDVWLSEPHRRKAMGTFAATTLCLGLAAVASYPGLREEGLSRAFLARESLVALIPLAVLAVVAATSRNTRILAVAVVAALLSQRGLEAAHQFPSVPRAQFYPAVEPIDVARDLAGAGRVAAMDDLLVPNTSTMYGLRDVRGYNALTLRRFRETFPLWAQPDSMIFNRIADPSSPLLTFLDVSLLLTRAESPVPSGWTEVAESNGVRLLRAPQPGRGALVPRRLRIGGTTEQRLEQMSRQADFEELSWIDRGDDVAEPLTEVVNGRGSVEIESAGPDFLLRTDLSDDAWIVVSATHWRGWRASTEGQPLPVAYANHAFVGVKVPAGVHTVLLRYRPAGWQVGLWVASTGGVATLLVLAAQGTLRRRRAPSC